MFKLKNMNNEILTLNIETQNPLLDDFADCLKAFNNQYYSFLKTKTKKIYRKENELILKEVKKGSYIFSVIEQQILDNGDVIIASILLNNYFEHLKLIFDCLLSNKMEELKQSIKMSVKDIKDWIKMLKPINLN
jgi:hypothetical protein